MKSYSSLIVTVGSSIKGNFLRDEKTKPLYENGAINEIVKKMESNEWGDPESARKYGSEINSTVSLLRNFERIEQAKFVKGNLYLFISDTEDGERIGNILKGFFEQNDEFRFGSVMMVKIIGLNHEDEHRFGTKGLRNVVREFAKVARTHRNNVIVNATGGYKAQIAFALALGQAMKFPVYYRFEAFSKIIKMPPLPVSLDWELYLENAELLEALEYEGEMREGQLNEYGYAHFAELPTEIKSFLERIKVDRTYYLALSPMGQVFLESARELIRLETPLETTDQKPKDKIIFNQKEGHAMAFEKRHKIVDKLSKLPFVSKVHSFDFKPVKKDTLSVKIINESIKVVFGSKKGIIYLDVSTTAKNKRELIAAVEEIKRNF